MELSAQYGGLAGRDCEDCDRCEPFGGLWTIGVDDAIKSMRRATELELGGELDWVDGRPPGELPG